MIVEAMGATDLEGDDLLWPRMSGNGPCLVGPCGERMTPRLSSPEARRRVGLVKRSGLDAMPLATVPAAAVDEPAAVVAGLEAGWVGVPAAVLIGPATMVAVLRAGWMSVPASALVEPVVMVAGLGTG